MKAALVGVALAVGFAPSAMCAGRGEANAPSQYDEMIARHARANGVPERLIRRIIVRESRYNPTARNGRYYGMMQIMPQTAKTMGFQGPPTALLDADTNLTYAVRYLAGAYKVAGGNEDRAVGFYARGYYYDAKRKGMADEVGLGRNAKFAAVPPPAVAPAAPAPAAEPVRVATAAPVPANRPAPQAAPAAFVPLPPVRDPHDVKLAAAAPAAEEPRSFLFARPTPPEAPKAPEPPASVVATNAGPTIPLPPVRDLPAVASAAKQQHGPALAGASPAKEPAQVAAASPSVPLPPVRGAAKAPAHEAVATAAPTARVISPNAAPVMAAAGPVAPSRPREPSAPTAPEAALSFAGAPRSAADAVPLPPVRSEATGTIGAAGLRPIR